MSCGREPRHTVLVLAGATVIVGIAGCRSPFVGQSERLAAEPSSSVARTEIPQLLPVPEKPLVTSSSRALAEEAVAPAAGETRPAATPIPLLDAALKRAEAVERTQGGEEKDRISLAARSGAAAVRPVVPNPAAPPREAVHAEDRQPKPAPVASAAAAPPAPAIQLQVRPQVVEWLASEAAKPANRALFERSVDRLADAIRQSRGDSTRPAEVASRPLATDDRAPLALGQPRLCGKVTGFGSFEPLPSTVLRGTAFPRLL